MKIAMWSGPRNLSTAMMYAFAARGDCAVRMSLSTAPFLAGSGSPHPMADTVMAAHETDPVRVAAACAAPVPAGHAHLYMKHMPHHMLPDFPLDWAEGCVHAHLIRHPPGFWQAIPPNMMQVSYEEIGFAQQEAFFEMFPGPVIDSADIRRDPEGMLKRSVPRSDCPSPTGCCAGPRARNPMMAPGACIGMARSTAPPGSPPPRGRCHRLRRNMPRFMPAPCRFMKLWLRARSGLDDAEAFCKRAPQPTGDATMTAPRKQLPIETPEALGRAPLQRCGGSGGLSGGALRRRHRVPAGEVPRRGAGRRNAARALPGLLPRDPHHHDHLQPGGHAACLRSRGRARDLYDNGHAARSLSGTICANRSAC
jgi:hypothetical protein